jgi:hypothetical protein
MAKTKVKQYLGVDIYLDADRGKFLAVIDGVSRELSSLKSVETAIRKSTEGVNVIVLNTYRSEPVVPEEPSVVRVLRSDGRELFDQSNHRVWGQAYAYSQGALDELREAKAKYEEALDQLKREWAVIWDGLESGLTRVDAADIARQLREAGEA